MKTFSEKTVERRHMANLTQAALSERVGVTPRTIKLWESGEKKPRPSALARLASALGVSVKYLTDDECDNPLEDIERDGYVEQARSSYGARGARDIQQMLDENIALFAGGEVSQEQKDVYFEALMTAYVHCKEMARDKFGRRQAGGGDEA